MILVSWKYISQVYWSTVSRRTGPQIFREQTAPESDTGILYTVMQMSFQVVVVFKQPADSH